ncbi:MAG: TRAP transporter fused permease subunit [Desulfuromonadales bacterium]|nr:TRAP transporter fused permease subunit [Desulfuromonadales bacterium]
MSAEQNEQTENISAEDQKKLKALLEKDERSCRNPSGFLKWLVALLGGAMVIFYFYSAGIAPVATQYHRGVYVFVTYVLVFLLYPAGKTKVRLPLTWVMGLVTACAVGGYFFFDDTAGFHTWLMNNLEGQDNGNFVLLWPIIAGSLAVTTGLLIIDRWSMKRWPRNPTLTDVFYAIASAAVVYYWINEFEKLNYRAGAENDLDALVSVLGIILSLEVCRRVLGWAMTFIGLFMICYGYFGPHFPEVMAHRGFSLERLSTSLFLTTNGVFGVMASVLATYVILFIFFGAFLHKSGAGRFFIDLPLAVAGRTTGGPAKVAVIASALFGSVSGSAIANTVSTGAFTIPLMKRAGFKPHVAGAIEPAASIGGMFMPPIMGAGGFLMAELTNTPYATIMLIAIFPALMYFFSVFCMIHFEAKKMGLKGIDESEMKDWKVVLKQEWYFSLPLVIITALMIFGKSPGYSAFWATISCIVISWFNKETRMGAKEIWEAIQTGAKNTLMIGATLGVIGIIVGTISLTGIGLKFSDIIISLASGNLVMALILVALASLVLGMGVPVTAAYLITAVLAVPPLAEMGVPILAAHFIVYWFSQDSNITPPVCVAAYAGAAIAGSDPWKTGWTSFKFAKLLYVMPILFAFTPAILFLGKPFDLKMGEIPDDMPFANVVQVNVKADQPFKAGDVLIAVESMGEIIEIKAPKDGQVIEVNPYVGGTVSAGQLLIEAEVPATGTAIFSSMFSCFLGTIAFSAVTMLFWIRKTSTIEWVLLAAGSILLYWPTLMTDLVGVALVGIVWLSQVARNKKDQPKAASQPVPATD